jgi:hypothetical protein
VAPDIFAFEPLRCIFLICRLCVWRKCKAGAFIFPAAARVAGEPEGLKGGKSASQNGIDFWKYDTLLKNSPNEAGLLG